MQIKYTGNCVNQEVNITATDKDDEDRVVRDGIVIVYFMDRGAVVEELTTDDEGIASFTPKFEGEYRVEVRKSSRYYTEKIEFDIENCGGSSYSSGISSETETTTTSVYTTTSTVTATTSSTITTPKETTSTSTTPETTTSSITKIIETTSTLSEETEKDEGSIGFIGRFLTVTGTASIFLALLILLLMFANTARKKGGVKKEANLWDKKGKTKLGNV